MHYDTSRPLAAIQPLDQTQGCGNDAPYRPGKPRMVCLQQPVYPPHGARATHSDISGDTRVLGRSCRDRNARCYRNPGSRSPDVHLHPDLPTHRYRHPYRYRGADADTPSFTHINAGSEYSDPHSNPAPRAHADRCAAHADAQAYQGYVADAQTHHGGTGNPGYRLG